MYGVYGTLIVTEPLNIDGLLEMKQTALVEGYFFF